MIPGFLRQAYESALVQARGAFEQLRERMTKKPKNVSMATPTPTPTPISTQLPYQYITAERPRPPGKGLETYWAQLPTGRYYREVRRQSGPTQQTIPISPRVVPPQPSNVPVTTPQSAGTFTGFITPETGAKFVIPLARQAEAQRQMEAGREPVPGLANALIGIFGQESSWGSNPVAIARTQGDVGPYQISEVFTQPGAGAHGLFIPREERTKFQPSFQFANDFITTYYRANLRNGMSSDEALRQAIIRYNGDVNYYGLVQGRLDFLRRAGLL